MSSISSRQFLDAFTDARRVLNDGEDDIYHDELLLPFAAQVHAEIQDEFSKHSIPLAETTTESLTYAANAETIVVPAGVTDFQAPLEIWEKSTTDEVWVPMQRVANLRAPLDSARDRLYEWEWRDGTIAVLACTSARDIFCRYRRQIAYPTSATAMGFDGIYWPLVYGTAAQAAVSTGRDTLAAVNGPLYVKRLGDAVHIASRDRQGIVYQQRGWRNRGRRGPIHMETS